MRPFLSSFFLAATLTCAVIPAGAGGPKKVRIYLSEVLEPTSKGKATYYLVPEGKDGDLYIGKIYTKKGKVKAEGRFKDPELTIEDGPFVFYHPNGKTESQGRYVMGKKSGIWERYDQWGQTLAEKVYDHEPLLNIVYTRAEVMPEAPGGEKVFLRVLQDKVIIPSGKEMKNSMAASFIVERTGELSDVKVIDGDGGEVDQRTVDVIRSTAPWKPGADKGLPVRVQMRIPVQF